MALSQKNRTEIVDLMAREVDFERSGISGCIVRDATAAPRQGELTDAEYRDLMETISFNDVRYVIFSYFTPIAWVHRNHDGVTLVERRFSATTSQHQKMIEDAYGEGRVNTRTPERKGEVPVVLSENEEIILRRMRDEDGTEYDMVFKGPASEPDQQRFCPRDQAESLVAKGLAFYLTGVAGHGEWGIVLSEKGRAHLNTIQPVKTPMEKLTAQYSGLAEADLIELADQKLDVLLDDASPQALELAAVIRCLKARHDATADARNRVGLYLRHVAIQQEQYDRDMASDSEYSKRNAKAPAENIDSLRSEEWTKAGELRLSDLQKLVPTRVFDGKQLFMDTQADRLEQWKQHPDYAALPEKQKALLPCIAGQHISNGYRGWTHDSDAFNRHECYTNIHQSTMNSLLKKKHIVGTRTRPGMSVHKTSYLVLLAPPQG